MVLFSGYIVVWALDEPGEDAAAGPVDELHGEGARLAGTSSR